MTSLASGEWTDEPGRDGFNELVCRHEARLRKRIYAILCAHVLRCWPVDDILQEVWLAVWAKRRTFQDRGPGSMRRWLNGIARFKSLDALRRYYRRSRREGGELEDVPDRPPAGGCDACPLTPVEREEVREAIDRCVAALSPVEREAYILVYRLRMSTREAGRLLGTTTDAAFHRAFRAAQSVIRCLGTRF